MDWQGRLREVAIAADFGDFALLYHAGLHPIVPPDYDLPGIVGLTFRLRRRPGGGHEYVTTLDLPAAIRIGARIGLHAAESIAMVDSHERVHIALQLAGVDEETEEEHAHVADAAWLSLRHPKAAELVSAGEFGIVTRVGPGFWEALVETAGES